MSVYDDDEKDDLDPPNWVLLIPILVVFVVTGVAALAQFI